jgi:hypothetical protein
LSVSCLRVEDRDSRVSRISPFTWDGGVAFRDWRRVTGELRDEEIRGEAAERAEAPFTRDGGEEEAVGGERREFGVDVVVLGAIVVIFEK